MRIRATVTVSLPMWPNTVIALNEHRARLREKKASGALDMNDAFACRDVEKELDARSEEGRAALKKAMPGWRLLKDDLAMFIGADGDQWECQYQQVFCR